jgi:hypothetical protein
MKVVIIAMFTVAALGALLLGATAAQHMQDAHRLKLAELQNASDRALITELNVRLQKAQQTLAERPVVEKLVTPPCPQIRDIGHETPVFSRDSQVYAR